MGFGKDHPMWRNAVTAAEGKGEPFDLWAFNGCLSSRVFSHIDRISLNQSELLPRPPPLALILIA